MAFYFVTGYAAVTSWISLVSIIACGRGGVGGFGGFGGNGGRCGGTQLADIINSVIIAAVILFINIIFYQCFFC